MSRIIIILLFLFFVTSIEVIAQRRMYKDNLNCNLGFGVGLDYGGLGSRFSVLPTEKVAVFGALGFNIHGAGVNGGAIYRIKDTRKFCPTLIAMYGYNAVILINGATTIYGESSKSKTYYGPTLGSGLEIKARKKNNFNFFNVELLVPFRSQEFKDDYKKLDENPNIKMSKVFPVTISLAYHFRL